MSESTTNANKAAKKARLIRKAAAKAAKNPGAKKGPQPSNWELIRKSVKEQTRCDNRVAKSMKIPRYGMKMSEIIRLTPKRVLSAKEQIAAPKLKENQEF